ncbi:hypothetical protein XELAEV_18019053mg [Xenopus laevis]|uniref:Large ribosomal subunit protein mL64 n=1 Tax=Xenopus laevis TaxID=8355 RepID=A0A974HU68_XENLA|nr:hypothetical protein XELAEV_18019053mg [Xenopus laevis]
MAAPLYRCCVRLRHLTRTGISRGVKPEGLLPSPEKLREIEEEKEWNWNPSLTDMLERVESEGRKKQENERIIAANLAKMVADWRREKREVKQKLREEKARKERLMAIACDKFGLNVDHWSPKFQEMVKELEKEEEKKKQKALKRIQKAESLAAAAPTTLAPSSPNAGSP